MRTEVQKWMIGEIRNNLETEAIHQIYTVYLRVIYCFEYNLGECIP